MFTKYVKKRKQKYLKKHPVSNFNRLFEHQPVRAKIKQEIKMFIKYVGKKRKPTQLVGLVLGQGKWKKTSLTFSIFQQIYKALRPDRFH